MYLIFFLGFIHAFPCALETHIQPWKLEFNIVSTSMMFTNAKRKHKREGTGERNIYGYVNLIMTLERIVKLQVRKLVALFEQEAKYWEHHREIEQHKFQQTQRLQPGLRSAYPNANKVCCKSEDSMGLSCPPLVHTKYQCPPNANHHCKHMCPRELTRVTVIFSCVNRKSINLTYSARFTYFFQ
jgi:hypothetical protein